MPRTELIVHAIGESPFPQSRTITGWTSQSGAVPFDVANGMKFLNIGFTALLLICVASGERTVTYLAAGECDQAHQVDFVSVLDTDFKGFQCFGFQPSRFTQPDGMVYVDMTAGGFQVVALPVRFSSRPWGA